MSGSFQENCVTVAYLYEVQRNKLVETSEELKKKY